AWNLPAIAFEYLAEDLQNLHHGAKTAVRTGVYQYAELDHQKRISMSGNSVESNSFCSLLKVAIVTSFFEFSLCLFKFALSLLEFIFNSPMLLIDFLKIRF
ncbi:MAG: hypothetical protein SPK34_10340, partial [Bacteroidaceae bacterium]|nr:hypothetical protein [Prevotellaceae bacterium]MDY5761307.1 hypothetical protein [Bacteroidaceae bacterium]